MTISTPPTALRSRHYGPLARLVRHWLGIDAQDGQLVVHSLHLAEEPQRYVALRSELGALQALVDGQRADFNGLAPVLEVRDRSQMQTEHLLRDAVKQLNRVTNSVGSMNSRLSHYENVIIPIRKAKAALVEATQREQRRREREENDAKARCTCDVKHEGACPTTPTEAAA